tara:strand:- start:656 stop:1234 length:579 start_codon:yes stop_codon:yes gene_type:complete
MIKKIKIKRLIDILMSILIFSILFIPVLPICILVKVTSKGPILYWSNRVGRNNEIFSMPKFRTMKIDTPEVATHSLKEADKYITRFGSLLRKYSLDEIPQLITIISGKMSFVGPRPALHNQSDLIKLRSELGIHHLVPGITGYAQINGRDEVSIEDKVELDLYYKKNYSIYLDVKILILTFKKVIFNEGIIH